MPIKKKPLKNDKRGYLNQLEYVFPLENVCKKGTQFQLMIHTNAKTYVQRKVQNHKRSFIHSIYTYLLGDSLFIYEKNFRRASKQANNELKIDINTF